MAARDTTALHKVLFWIGSGSGLLAAGLVAAWNLGALNGVALWAIGRATGYDISCAHVTGNLLASFQCRDLALADAKGRFLSAHQLTLDWDAFSLVRNRIALTRVAARDVKLTRVPESAPSASDASVLPGIEIAVGALDVRRIDFRIDSAASVCMNVNGKGSIGPDGFDAGLRLTRCVPKNGKMTFNGQYDENTGALRLHAEGSDNGAIVAAITGMKSVGKTVVALDGSGTRDAFNGKFAVSIAEVGDVEAAFRAHGVNATYVDTVFHLSPTLWSGLAPTGEGRLSANMARAPRDGLFVDVTVFKWGAMHGTAQFARAADGALSGQIAGGGSTLEKLRLNFAVASGPSGARKAGIAGYVGGARFPAQIRQLIGSDFRFLATADRAASGSTTFTGAVNGATANLNAVGTIQHEYGSAVISLAVPDIAKAALGVGGSVSATMKLARVTLSGDAEGDLTMTGSNITGRGVGVALGRSPRLTAHVRAEHGLYTISDLSLATVAATARGTAKLMPGGGFMAQLATTHGDAAPLLALADISGNGGFSLRATATGTVSAPSLTVNGDAPLLVIGGKSVRMTALVLSARKARQWVSQFALDAITPAGVIALTMDMQTQIDGWRAHIGRGVLGPATLYGTLAKEGDMLQGALTLKGDVLKPVGLFLGQSTSGIGMVSLSGRGKMLRLTADMKHVAAGPLTNATVKASASAPSLDAPAALLLAVRDGANSLDAAGIMTRTPFDTRLTRLTGDWAGARFALMRPAKFAANNGIFELGKTVVGVGGGTLELAGNGGPGRISASAHLKDMPAEPVAALLQLGRANGKLDLDATANMTPQRTQADLVFAGKKLIFARSGKRALPVDVKFAAGWNGRVLSSEGRVTGLGENPATVQVRIPVVRVIGGYAPSLARSGPISAHLRAQMPVQALLAFLPISEQSLSGALDASVDVGGDITAPVLSGKIAIMGGRYDNFESGTRLEKLNASLAAEGGNIAALNLTATDGGSGSLSAKGKFLLTSLEAGGVGQVTGHADLSLFNADVLRMDQIRASASGTVAIDFPGDRPPTLTGKLKTSVVRVDIGAAMPPDIPEINVTDVNGIVPAAPPAPKLSLFSKAALDIVLTMPNRVYVSGHGLDSEWSGRLNIGGALSKPDVTGSLDLVRGQAELVGKNFTLENGKVIPDASAKGGATVHLRAQNTASDLTVTVTAEGPVADPEITWSSAPSLPKDEILSRLFFGTSTPRLTAFQALQLAQLSGQVGHLASGGGVLSFARRLTGLDVLRVETPSDLSGTGASIAAGKYITDKVYVGVKQGADVSAGTAQVEVKITPHITLDAEAGVNSQGSLEAAWKWDY